MKVPGRDIGWRALVVTFARKFSADDLIHLAGSVTFFSVLSLFPFLLFLLSLASLVIDPATANELIADLGRIAPRAVTVILGARIEALGRRSSGGVLGLSLGLALFAASGVVISLTVALNRVFGVEERRPLLKAYAVAIVTVFCAATLGLASMAVAVITPLVAERTTDWVASLLLSLRFPVAGVVMMFVWALLYHFLPNRRCRFKLVTPGSVIGVLAWVLASVLFSLYVNRSPRYELLYGTLGGAIILLTWLWISAIVLLGGAALNAILEVPPCPASRPVVAQRREDRPAPPPVKAPPAPRPKRHPLEIAAAFGLGLLAGRRLTR